MRAIPLIPHFLQNFLKDFFKDFLDPSATQATKYSSPIHCLHCLFVNHPRCHPDNLFQHPLKHGRVLSCPIWSTDGYHRKRAKEHYFPPDHSLEPHDRHLFEDRRYYYYEIITQNDATHEIDPNFIGLIDLFVDITLKSLEWKPTIISYSNSYS
jgi:hypothetical protein